MKLRQGFLRLGISLAGLWFGFWTCAYVIKPQLSENSPGPIAPTLSLTAEIALIAVAVFSLWWIVSGIRSG
ncbi:MAG TPA: hypothetical protein VJ770_10590 [Stellaceae bacterium]|nr:hypothetical protein [Stellaceae bacterium]